MNNVIPLPVYPHKPTGADLEMLKQAKALLGIDILIQPVDAVPGSPGRILALRESPNWICDHALVREPSVESLRNALDWIINLTDNPRGTTVIKMLKEIFGNGVKEIG